MDVPDPAPSVDPDPLPAHRSLSEPDTGPATPPGTTPSDLTPPHDLPATFPFTSTPDLTPPASGPPAEPTAAFDAYRPQPGYPATRAFPTPAGPAGATGLPVTQPYPTVPLDPAPGVPTASESWLPPVASSGPESWPPPPSCDVPEPRRRRWPALVAVVAVALAAAGAVYFSGRHSTAIRPAALATVAPTPTPVPTVAPTPTGPPRSLNDLLDVQSQALLAGDEKAFMSTVDPAAKAAVKAYRQIYTNLRALHVSAWSAFADAGRGKVTKRATATVSAEFCLVAPGCEAEQATFKVVVAPHKKGPLIESYTPPKASNRSWEPYPWEISHLNVAEGGRVILVASDNEKSRLQSLLDVTVKAAAVADTYTQWGKPTKYLVFLASRQEASVWFGGMSRNAIGEEMPIGAEDNEVIIRLPQAITESGTGGVRATIQHELGHVVTLYDAQRWHSDTLVEGIAEYIAVNGHPSWATSDMAAVRWYVRGGRWSGQCYMTKEISSSDLRVANAAYGIGYLTIKFLMTRYGREKAMNFFSAVDRYGGSLDTGARDNLGAPWKTVNAACASYIRHVARS